MRGVAARMRGGAARLYEVAPGCTGPPPGCTGLQARYWLEAGGGCLRALVRRDVPHGRSGGRHHGGRALRAPYLSLVQQLHEWAHGAVVDHALA